MKNLLRTFILLFLSGLLAGALFAQEKTGPSQDPKFQVYVDTAGVSPVADSTGNPVEGVFLTWVYAKTSDNAPPSAGVLVAFDCKEHKVMRIAHVVFRLAADKHSVEGAIVEEEQPEWVPVSNPRTFNLVCEVGAEHAKGHWGPDVKHQAPQYIDPRVRQA